MPGPTLRILSAGAPKGGVRGCAEAFGGRTGRPFTIEFATAPVIRERVSGGTAGADLVVAPLEALEEFAGARLVLPGSIAPIGSVAAGIVARDGAVDPDIGTAEALVRSILAAERIVYNVASSGEYIARMIEDLGLAAAVEAKTVRLPNGRAVMEHVAADPAPTAFGFGQITEIRLQEHLGIHVVGPLPEPVAHATAYGAAVLAAAEDSAPAADLVAFMGSPEGREIFRATGVA